MLELRDLSKRYGNVVALDGLSFAVEPGQMFGFVGPNGAGKTTAMRIVIGVLAADAGEVRWRGEPLTIAARRRIGYMPEERGLYPKMRVGDQLAYLAQLHGMSEPEAHRRAGAWAERLGIAERMGDNVEELSLGNQQRVQLAAALVHGPELLILDEPFSGLDPVGVDVLSEMLLHEAHERGVPVVFSSHQLELVERLCDAVAIIRDGRLIAAGGVEELRARRAGRRWRAEVSGRDGGWARRLSGAHERGRHVYELDEGVDPEALLDAARSAGRVVRFGPETPTLAELFRDVVAETRDQPPTPGAPR
jgi:ABC-2 type transport system ATP-binding protein